MNFLFLISETTIPKGNITGPILQYKITHELHPKSLNPSWTTITSAQIAQHILHTIPNKAIGSNNEIKAKEITHKGMEETHEVYLVYSDRIKTNLEKKLLIIIEENEEVKTIDTTKIYCTPPNPIIIEYIIAHYPNIIIKTLNEQDDEYFQISSYYNNIQYELG